MPVTGLTFGVTRLHPWLATEDKAMDEQVAPEVEPGQTHGSTASAQEVSPTVEPGGTLSYTPEDGPWGLKRIATSDKELAIAAAKRANRRVGDWLGEAIRAHVAAEREPVAGYAVLAPEVVRDHPLPAAISGDELRALLILGEELRAKMGWRRYPARLGRAIHRAMLVRLEGRQ
jgi:hypothetical protein